MIVNVKIAWKRVEQAQQRLPSQDDQLGKFYLCKKDEKPRIEPIKAGSCHWRKIPELIRAPVY